MNDLTILYITASNMPERWMKFQIGHLLKSIGDTPIISISRKPLNLGMNIVESEPKCYWNIFMQNLNGALLAKTPFVAIAEDDTLYTKEHFTEFRPPLDSVSYNRSRWSLFTWDNIYCLRQRISNCSCIAPRELMIESFTEWKTKYPKGAADSFVGELGRSRVERRMGTTPRKMVEWYSTCPVIQLNHPTGSDTGDYGLRNGKHMVKKHGQLKAYDIPYWGKATDIVKVYNGTE
jgi:hypothetical protein